MKAKTARATAARKKANKAHATARKQKREISLQAGRRNLQIAVGALVVIILSCYANSLGNGFVFDDYQVVLIDGRPTSFARLLQMLTSSYRPLRNLSYAIDFGIWGARPLGFHLTNIVIHAANTLLVLFLVRRLTDKLLSAFLAAAIFAIHPIQTDAVTYISGRRDILFSLFYLAAFHSYLSYRGGRSLKYLGAFLGLWALSLMSKEMAVSLPLVVFVWNFCDLWGEQSGSWLRRSLIAARKAFAADKWLYIGLAIASTAYAWYQTYLVQASLRAGNMGFRYWGSSLFATVLTVLRVHAWYLKQLVFPTPIAQYYGAFDISSSLLDWRVLSALLLIVSTLVAAFVLLNKNRLMAFAVFSYFALLLPVSQIIPHHELLADHYLYLPMMSFGLLVALLTGMIAARGKQARQLAYGAAGVWVVVLSLMTVSRNRDWKDDFTVWKANYEAAPNSPRAAYNLGSQYLERDPKKAEALFREALADDPNYKLTYVPLAQMLVSQNRTREAEEVIQRGLDSSNDESEFSFVQQPLWLRSKLIMLLGGAKWQEGDRPEGERLLREAISLYPTNVEAYEVLANCYHSGDRIKEQEVLKEALAVNSSAYETYARLASLLIEDKKPSEALPYLTQMLALSPTEADCRIAARYITAAKGATPGSGEYRSILEALRAVEQRCRQ